MNPERIISDVLEKTLGSIRYQHLWNGENILALIPMHVKNDVHYHELFFNDITRSYFPIDRRLHEWVNKNGETNPFIITKIDGIEEGIAIMKDRFIFRIKEGFFDKDLEDMKEFMECIHRTGLE